MKNRKKLTAIFLSTIMALSLGMGTAADEIDTSDTLDENESISSVTDIEFDESINTADPDEAIEPRWADYYEYIDNPEYAYTSGGAGGRVKVEYGIYKRYRDPGSGHRQFMNYGVSLMIVDSESDGSSLKTKLAIEPVGRDGSHNYYFETVEADAGLLRFDYPTNYDYTQLSAIIKVGPGAFGEVEKPVNRNP